MRQQSPAELTVLVDVTQKIGFSYSLQVLEMPQNSSYKLITTLCFWYLLALHLYLILNELIITNSSISQICDFIFWYLHFNISIPLFSIFQNMVLSKGPLSSPDAKGVFVTVRVGNAALSLPSYLYWALLSWDASFPCSFITNVLTVCQVPDTLESLATQTHVC